MENSDLNDLLLNKGEGGDLLHNLPLVSSPPRVMMLQEVRWKSCGSCLWPIISLSLDLRSFSIVGIFTSPKHVFLKHICNQNVGKMFGHDRTWTCTWCPTGLEPAISRSEVWCIMHYATSCSTNWATWPVRAPSQKSRLLTQPCNMRCKLKVAPHSNVFARNRAVMHICTIANMFFLRLW